MSATNAGNPAESSGKVLAPGRINGIDVSGLQWPINAQAVADAGFRFVYVKSSQYSSTKDGRYNAIVEELSKAGLTIGPYHFCSHDSDPVAQADFFYRASSGLGSKVGELPPMADWEFCTPERYSNHPAHCVDWIEKFTARCDELWYPNNDVLSVPRKTVLYTFPDYARRHQPVLSRSVPLAGRPLCYASYASEPDGKGGYRLKGWLPSADRAPLHQTPAGLSGPVLWQYSGNNGYKVPGIKPDCDRQVFMGTEAEFQVFLGRPAVRPVDVVEGTAAITVVESK